MRRKFDDWGFELGWQRGDWWLSLCAIYGRAWYLDVGKVRFRWAGREFRPLFSERYGAVKWRKVGRLGVNYKRTRAFEQASKGGKR